MILSKIAILFLFFLLNLNYPLLIFVENCGILVKKDKGGADMPFIIAAIVLVAAAAIAVSAYLGSPSYKGKAGEKAVDSTLQSHGFEKRYTVSDLTFISEEKSVQIDHVHINRHGLFVIETKNYGGRIYGSDGQYEWTQVLGRTKNKFYNPVKQNATHVYHLSKILPKKVPINSIVVFVRNNTSFITSNSVIGLSSLPEYLSRYRADVLSDDDIDELYDFLMDLKASCDVTKLEHIQSIDDTLRKVGDNICPRCGGNLLVRSGKYGEFFGCVNYPDCTFTKNFDI